MRHALRLLLCTGLLAGLFAPLTWAQSWPYIYTYANLSRAGGSVYAYASSQLAYPYYQCDGQMQYQGIDCWASYTSYAQAILLKDGGYRGSSYASFWGNPSQASVSADVDVGEWQLQTEHRIDDLEWADAYDREWFIWRYDYLYNYDYRQLTLSPEISISGEQTVYDGNRGVFSSDSGIGGTHLVYVVVRLSARFRQPTDRLLGHSLQPEYDHQRSMVRPPRRSLLRVPLFQL